MATGTKQHFVWNTVGRDQPRNSQSSIDWHFKGRLGLRGTSMMCTPASPNAWASFCTSASLSELRPTRCSSAPSSWKQHCILTQYDSSVSCGHTVAGISHSVAELKGRLTAKAIAMALPMPEDAPVIRADLPCRSFCPFPTILLQSTCST